MGKEDRSRKGRKTVKAVKKQGMETVRERQERGKPDRWGCCFRESCLLGIPVPSALGGEGAVFGGVFYAAAAVCVSGDGKSGGCVLDVTGAGKE